MDASLQEERSQAQLPRLAGRHAAAYNKHQRPCWPPVCSPTPSPAQPSPARRSRAARPPVMSTSLQYDSRSSTSARHPSTLPCACLLLTSHDDSSRSSTCAQRRREPTRSCRQSATACPQAWAGSTRCHLAHRAPASPQNMLVHPHPAACRICHGYDLRGALAVPCCGPHLALLRDVGGQLREVGGGGTGAHKLLHRGQRDAVHVERQRLHGGANHGVPAGGQQRPRRAGGTGRGRGAWGGRAGWVVVVVAAVGGQGGAGEPAWRCRRGLPCPARPTRLAAACFTRLAATRPPVVDKLDGFGVEREGGGARGGGRGPRARPPRLEEELHRHLVQLQADGLEQVDVVALRVGCVARRGCVWGQRKQGRGRANTPLAIRHDGTASAAHQPAAGTGAARRSPPAPPHTHHHTRPPTSTSSSSKSKRMDTISLMWLLLNR